MNLRYRTATISFCLDLTDPEAVSVPVAVFLAGDAWDIRIAALATRTNHPLRSRLDPLAGELLDMLPSVLHAQVDRVCGQRHGTLRDLFAELCDSFRNSLFVTGVSEELTRPMEQEVIVRARVQAMTGAAQDVLNKAIFQAAGQIDDFHADHSPTSAAVEELDQVNVQAWPFRPACTDAQLAV